MTRDPDAAADLVQEAFLVWSARRGGPRARERPRLAVPGGDEPGRLAWSAGVRGGSLAGSPRPTRRRGGSRDRLSRAGDLGRDPAVARRACPQGRADGAPAVGPRLCRRRDSPPCWGQLSHLATRALLCRARARLRDDALSAWRCRDDRSTGAPSTSAAAALDWASLGRGSRMRPWPPTSRRAPSCQHAERHPAGPGHRPSARSRSPRRPRRCGRSCSRLPPGTLRRTPAKLDVAARCGRVDRPTRARRGRRSVPPAAREQQPSSLEVAPVHAVPQATTAFNEPSSEPSLVPGSSVLGGGLDVLLATPASGAVSTVDAGTGRPNAPRDGLPCDGRMPGFDAPMGLGPTTSA